MRERKRPGTTRDRSRRRGVVFFIVAGVAAALLAADASIQRAYAQRILPGVRIGNVEVGGETYEKALDRVREEMTALESEGLALRYGGDDILLEFTLADTSGLGLATNVLEYDPESSVRRAAGLGRRSPLVVGALDRFRSIVGTIGVDPVLMLDEENLERALKRVLNKLEDPVVEPGFKRSAKGGISVTAPQDGDIFDYATIAHEVRERVVSLSREPVAISRVHTESRVSSRDAETLVPTVERLVEGGSLVLRSEKKTISVKSDLYLRWLVPVKDKAGRLSLGTTRAVVEEYLNGIKPEVSTPAKEAKFAITDGRVTEFQTSSPGIELDVGASAEEIARVLGAGKNDVAFVMRRADPKATEGNIANLGIKELVAVGRTNFSGSPPNRRYNIGIAVKLLNGLLIKPGEEFSLIKAVGPVDATLGYRQELVIKGDRTIPEYGGGLCQIGTTMFRLVLNAGLPILERRNHSYRVRYYEPPVGMDATIYEPKPDFRFKNDYAGYLLLQARVEGDDLVFEFWGKKDGRIVTLSKPRVYNVVSPPPQLTIETTDLKPGETKCTEKAHVGSDAEFTYTVEYLEGRKEQQAFKSHYKPWRAVCFVGVKEIKKKDNGADEEKNGVNSNTNANAKNTNGNVNAGPVNTNSVVNTNANTSTN